MTATSSKVVAGFITGALALLIFHQGLYLIMQQAGLPLRGSPWNVSPDPNAFGLPRLVNLMFWSGLWGIVFALMFERLPGGMPWLKGFLFGMVFPMLLGSWILVAAIKGQPLFNGAFAKGFDILALRNGFRLNGVGFGIGLGVLYPLVARALGLGATPRADRNSASFAVDSTARRRN